MVKLKTLADLTVTTAGTRVQINSGTLLRCTSCVLQAHEDNTGKIYIGDADVAAGRGIALAPDAVFAYGADQSGRPGGEEFDLASIYVDAETNGNKVKILYVAR